MQERSYFKFGLYLKNPNTGDQVISERIFDADVYNQPTRYSVDVKPLSREIISSFQKTLSTKSQNLDFKTYVGKDANGKKKFINHLGNNYNFDYPEDLSEAFKFTLKIGENIIIEREFTVNRFNHKAIFSNEIMDMVDGWVSVIQSRIKANDNNHMWQENALIERLGLQIQEVRGLDKEKKEFLLSKISYN